MMRLKRYSRNSVNPALLSLSLLATILLFGCSTQTEPTYKAKNIPATIKRICKQEYGIDVAVRVVGKTLWVYTPVERIIDKDYAVTKDKFFDEAMSEETRNIMTAVGRVLISSESAPEFYCLVISDVKEKGLDYIIIADTLDVKKSYANFIPFTEMNKRYVVKLEEVPAALGDLKGAHIKPYDISRREFIAGQITQRIDTRFREDDFRSVYEVKSVKAQFSSSTLIIDADIKLNEMRLVLPEDNDINREGLKATAEVCRAYDFWDFQDVTINDTERNKTTSYSRAVIEAVK